VRAYYDENESHVVAVVETTDSPITGKDTYVTASLHASPNALEGRDIRVEFLIVSRTDQLAAANVVATSAFCVVKDGWLAAPGVVFPDVVAEFFPGTKVPHVMWAEPFSHEHLSSMAIAGVEHDVHVLQGVPLATSEADFLRANGFDALEELLAAAQVDVADLWRTPVC
jgi:hypothetical protein